MLALLPLPLLLAGQSKNYILPVSLRVCCPVVHNTHTTATTTTNNQTNSSSLSFNSMLLLLFFSQNMQFGFF
jgi:hypothetical protein